MIEINPIGRVENSIYKRTCLRKCREIVSAIVLDPEHAGRLEGIEKYSHIEIIFWMHKVPAKERRRKKVPYVVGGKKVKAGVFSTRVQFRPNPIGITLVELVEKKDNFLLVKGLEAMSGTPVLDIKPFTRHPLSMYSPRGLLKVAPWANKRPSYHLK